MVWRSKKERKKEKGREKEREIDIRNKEKSPVMGSIPEEEDFVG